MVQRRAVFEEAPPPVAGADVRWEAGEGAPRSPGEEDGTEQHLAACGYGYGCSTAADGGVGDGAPPTRTGRPKKERVIDLVRRTELTRLHPSERHPQGVTPLDQAGAALYSERQLQQAFDELKASVLSNPHSATQPSSLAGAHRAELVRLTLAMCNAPSDLYDVVFTSGTTAALKLVSECLPWCEHSVLAHMRCTHNSVLGMREPVLAAGGTVRVMEPCLTSEGGGVGLREVATSCRRSRRRAHQGQGRPGGPCACTASCHTSSASHPPGSSAADDTCPLPHDASCGGCAGVRLAVLPHECNFTGQRLDLALVRLLQRQGLAAQGEEGRQGQGASGPSGAGALLGGRWLVMLDAAKSCATSPPDLARHPVDLVALSYYKIIGYPTGLGALVVRREVLPLLTRYKRYFGGGTVEASLSEEDWFARRGGAAGLEDGTPAFAAIAAARHGLRFVRDTLGGWGAVRAHAAALGGHLVAALRALRHHGGTGPPLVVMYGREPGTPGVESWGPTVAFNLKRADGSWVGYAEVGRLAELHGIQLRTGCFCNPGACALYLGLTGDEVRENYAAGHVCWDDRDLGVGDRPTGAVRVSLGHLSCLQDVDTLVRFLQRYFLAPAPSTPAAPAPLPAPPAPIPCISNPAAPSCPPPAPSPPPPPTPPPGSSTTAPTSSSALAPAPLTPGGSPTHASPQGAPQALPAPHVAAMYIYPIKSCGAQQVQRWPVGPTGLRYDREWALVDDAGHVVTQKLCPRAALVMPCVDLDARTLTIAAPKGPPPPSAGSSSTGARLGPLVVSLDEGSAGDAREEEERDGAAGQGQEEGPQQQQERTIRVCGDTVCGLVVTQSVTLTSSSSSSSSSSAATGPPQSARAVMRAWFQAALGVPCVLVRQREGARAARAGTGGTGRGAGPEPASSQAAHGSGQAQPRASIGFANDGQFLLVNAASVDDVNARLAAAAMAKAASEVAAPPLQGSSSSSSSVALPFAVPTSPVELLRFRPNLVVEGLPPYAEDAWRSVQVGDLRLGVLGTCPRCEMLQVDQLSGSRGKPDVLLTLAQYRRFNGRMHFGILLVADPTTPSGGSPAGVSPAQAEPVAPPSRPPTRPPGAPLELAVGDVLVAS